MLDEILGGIYWGFLRRIIGESFGGSFVKFLEEITGKILRGVLEKNL